LKKSMQEEEEGHLIREKHETAKIKIRWKDLFKFLFLGIIFLLYKLTFHDKFKFFNKDLFRTKIQNDA
jgi:hypothetical protein